MRLKSSIEVQAVVVEYRSPERTVFCVASLLEQLVSRVVIVDNSHDGGATRAFLSSRYATERRVVIVDSGGNLGFAKAVNLGVASCQADRVLLINNDAVLEAGAVRAMDSALDDDLDSVVAVPSLLHAGRPLGRIYYHCWSLALTSRRWPGAFEVPRGACMLLALDRWPSLPLFDERFFMYGEELELGWRLAAAGKSITHATAAKVVHLGSGAAGNGSKFYEERTALAHLLMDSVVSSSKGCSMLLLARRSALLMRAVVRCIRSRSLVPFRAYRAALRSLTNTTEVMSSPPL